MDRRTFLQGVPVAVGSLLAGCSANTPVPGWSLSSAAPHEDPRMRVLRYAVLAPNSHNAQPWLVDLSRASEILLYVDRSRLLAATDPKARQIHISQGTFLELLDIAARQFDYRPEFEYFPEGRYDSAVVEARPVARVTLFAGRSVSQDRLFASILARHTNKRPFDTRMPVLEAQWGALRAAIVSTRIDWRQVTAAPERRTLALILKDAMAIEVSGRERNRETAEWFRFSDDELAAKRDGFGIAQNGATGVKKWIAEKFVISRERARDPGSAFARSAIGQTEEQAASAPAFAALVTPNNSRFDQVLAGQAYARLHLEATRLGLQMQPFSQALEEYPEMSELQTRLKAFLGVPGAHTVQMLFRLGHAAPSVHTPRRDPASMVCPSMACPSMVCRVGDRV